MYKVHCLNAISEKGTDILKGRYIFTDSLSEADAVMVRSAVMHALEVPQSLLCVARAGAGVNNIPLDKYAKEGIVVFNTPGANANAVKELVIAGLLMAARDIHGGMEWIEESVDDENIAKDAEVNFLAWSDSAHSYAYVEYKADGLRVRGFVPADAIAD